MVDIMKYAKKMHHDFFHQHLDGVVHLIKNQSLKYKFIKKILMKIHNIFFLTFFVMSTTTL